MSNSRNRLFSSPRILTHGRLVLLALGLLCLCANSMGDIIERYNSSGQLTASGDELHAVQMSTANGGPQDGDVIKISQNITASIIDEITLDDGDRTHTYKYNVYLDNNSVHNFTLQSSTAASPVTISAGASANERDFSLYFIYNSNISTINLKDVNFNGFNHSFFNEYYSGNPSITINADNVTFENGQDGYNIGYIRGCDFKMNGYNDNSIINFNNNMGAICSRSCELSKGKFNFTENSATWARGSAIVANVLVLSNGEFNFTDNSSYSHGGAIASFDACYLSNGVFNFIRNTSIDGSGSAFFSEGDCLFSDGEFNFIGNTTSSDGGAIYSRNITEYSNSQLNFTNNSTQFIGGAIVIEGFIIDFEEIGYDKNILTFSGDNTVATFTGNITTATKSDLSEFLFGQEVDIDISSGNDIFLWGFEAWDESHTYSALTFKDKGTYFFDGGICLFNMQRWEKELGHYSGDAEVTLLTTIDEAQVTIAGRQYKPVINEGDPANVEDLTNIYTLENVIISNGGKLSAELDYINGLMGDFTISGSESLVELTKGEQTATIKSSTGDDASFELIYESDGAVSSESLFISSGRVDVKGAMTAELEVGENAMFSPGNSVESLTLDGNFSLDSGATLLMEFSDHDDLSYDTLTVENGTVTIDPNAIINLYFESGDADEWATEGEEYQLVYANGFVDETTDLSRLLGNYKDYFKLEGRQGGLYLIGLGAPEPAVPEPSTWALLILGAAGLLYVRKRNRK